MLPNENNTCLSLLMLEQCISNASAYYSLIIRPIAWSRHVYLCYQAICLGQRTMSLIAALGSIKLIVALCLCATTTRDKTCASIFVDPIDRDVWSIILCAQGSLIFVFNGSLMSNNHFPSRCIASTTFGYNEIKDFSLVVIIRLEKSQMALNF